MRKLALCSLLFSLSLFAQNQPPSAVPQTVFTEQRTEIILQGSDAEGGDLAFSIVAKPQYGDLSEPEAIVPPPETDPRTGETVQPPITSARVVYTPGELVPDEFTFAVKDQDGATGTAVVSINPADEPPPPPATEVDAHDTEATVYANTLTTLTLTGSAPEKESLKFALLSRPESGQTSELTQGTEEPRRTASLTYLPKEGFLGEDSFEFEACGDSACDRAVYRINVVERPVEAPRLVSDIEVKTLLDRPVDVALDQNDHRTERGETIELRAIVTGSVGDRDGDGFGDSADGDASRIHAGVNLDDVRTARMQFEWPLDELSKLNIVSADVRLTTYRAEKEGVVTMFHATGEGDGELAASDFESEGERVRGAVMPVPSLEEMPLGEKGTYTFSILGDLRDALARELRVLSIQGRVANEKQEQRGVGLDVITNVESELGPLMIVETSTSPKPLAYTITALPEAGILQDSTGHEIRQVPYTLPDAVLRYVPKTPGVFTVKFSGTDGTLIDAALLNISVLRGSCANNPAYCNNGR